MCGILGFTHSVTQAHDFSLCGLSNTNLSEYDPILGKMMAALHHRGPDAQSAWSDANVSLGFTRLSILDLDQGGQPIRSLNGMVISVFNGEIYNHLVLRNDLESKGYRFKSDHSDGELIPNLYLEYGLAFPRFLKGMFAIALYDIEANMLCLVRDRVGIKPLYYVETNNQLIFASEIKSLFMHPEVRKEPNYQALYHYFSFKNIPSPFTAFQGIFQLKPGEMLTRRQGQIERQQWWSLDCVDRQLSFSESAQEVRECLEASVDSHHQADVEVGAFLSGGVDSSSVVALMAEKSSKPIKTFTLIYDEEFVRKNHDRYNAKVISERYATEHYEYVMTENYFWSELEVVANCFDEPFSGVTSTYFLSELIAKHVKVALSGDGADELFGSYLSHRLAQPLADYSTLSKKQRLLWQHPEFTQNYLEELASIQSLSERRMRQTLWSDADKNMLFTTAFKQKRNGLSSAALLTEIYSKSEALDPLNQALYLDFHTLLPDQILNFIDKLSMHHSLEVRPVFLDHTLIELAFAISGSHKIKHQDVKRVLKEAVKDLLPNSIINRPKEGFVLPINFWLQRDRFNKIPEFLTEEIIIKSEVFNWKKVLQVKTLAAKGCSQSQMRLWNIMMFCLWWRTHFL